MSDIKEFSIIQETIEDYERDHKDYKVTIRNKFLEIKRIIEQDVEHNNYEPIEAVEKLLDDIKKIYDYKLKCYEDLCDMREKLERSKKKIKSSMFDIDQIEKALQSIVDVRKLLGGEYDAVRNERV
jgi:predicted S18 family serine protease